MNDVINFDHPLKQWPLGKKWGKMKYKNLSIWSTKRAFLDEIKSIIFKSNNYIRAVMCWKKWKIADTSFKLQYLTNDSRYKIDFFFVVKYPYNQQIYSGVSIGCVWSRMPRYTQSCTKYWVTLISRMSWAMKLVFCMWLGIHSSGYGQACPRWLKATT